MKTKTVKNKPKTITVSNDTHRRAVLASALIGRALGEFAEDAICAKANPILMSRGLAEKVIGN